ncbi:hypothetical protein MIZ03_1069 [Rhodoferax lithotrophicus]|uniref:Uncharacterized protein n=1 Tax=Rhodoferax lithotrophicus TaxID=2798804 RepID=A0ABN6D2D6_9BURK|nr:hypothetical protein MIZ03_1069 [Rhodoferax sp. MIZ03]
MLSQSGSHRAKATAEHIAHMRTGIGLTSIWDDLKSLL